MLAYYGSRISANMTRTPEGYLICHNVPMARTGVQQYLGRELGLNDRADQIIKVYRTPEEVFSPATLASAEGKPTTDNHPPGHLTAETIAGYSKGHVQNVRRGTGEEEDLLIADLFYTDPVIIDQIESGSKREISSGYECIYVPYQDGFSQTNILINHVALVQKGRAGSRVAIKDSNEEFERGRKTMSVKKITLNFLAGLGFKQFVQDAEPEQIAEAAQALAGNETPAAPGAPAKDEDPMKAVMAAIAQLQAQVAQLMQAQQPAAPQDALDALESELKPDGDGGGGAKVIEPEKKTEPAVKTGDSSTVLNMVRSLKPVVAQIQDTAVRKQVSDAMAGALRSAMGTTPAQPPANPYAALTLPQQSVKDSKPDQDPAQIGRGIMEKYNPHYRKGGK